MSNSPELCVMFTCDQTKIRPVIEKIIASLPSLSVTPVEQIREGTYSHYEETDDISALSTFIHENVSQKFINVGLAADEPRTRSKTIQGSFCASRCG